MRVVVVLFLAVLVSASLCACRRAGPPRQKTYRASGKVTVDGKPVAHLKVVARAKQIGTEQVPLLPQANTKDDGSFELYSYEPGDGVPTGDYTLTFTWQNFTGIRYDGPDKLKNRYADPEKSTFKLKVDKGPVDLGTIDLTTK